MRTAYIYSSGIRFNWAMAKGKLKFLGETRYRPNRPAAAIGGGDF